MIPERTLQVFGTKGIISREETQGRWGNDRVYILPSWFSLRLRVSAEIDLVPAGGGAAFIGGFTLRGSEGWCVVRTLRSEAGSGGKSSCFPDFLATANSGVRLIYIERFIMDRTASSQARRDRRAGGHGSADAECGMRSEGRIPAMANTDSRAKQTQFRKGVKCQGVLLNLRLRTSHPTLPGRRPAASLRAGPVLQKKPIWRLAGRKSGPYRAKQTQFGSGPACETKPILREFQVEV